MREKIGRREFIKTAGAVAGAAAFGAAIPKTIFSETADAIAPAISASAILRPSFVAPAIVSPGADIPFIAAEDAGVALTSVWLQPAGGGGRIPLTQAGSSLKPGGTLEPGLYDLYADVTRNAAAKIERQPHAVNVTAGFKKDFVFGVISDVHFGDVRIQQKLPSFKVPDAVSKEMAALKERGVEFCLCCGDLCFIPPKTKNELLNFADAITAGANFPVFTVPGNHDGYCSGAAGKIQYDTFTHWRKYFGAFNHVTRYGGISLIGVNTYDKDASERNIYGGIMDRMDMGAVGAPQLAWLEAALKNERAANPAGTVIVFGHHNPTNSVVDVNGSFEVKPFSDAGRAELLALFESYSVDAYFCGHVHGIYEETHKKTRIITAPTAGSMPAEGFPVGCYIVKVAGGRIADVETVEIARV